MGSKEILDAEFECIEIENIEFNEDEVEAYIVVSAGDILASRTEGLQLIKDFSKNILLAKINNFFSMFTGGIEDYSFYEAEVERLDEEVSLSIKFSNYYNKLLMRLDDNNYLDVYKMAKLVGTYYSLYLDRLEEERRGIYFSSMGIDYSRSMPSIPSLEEFDDYFSDKLDNVRVIKVMEKNKKM